MVGWVLVIRGRQLGKRAVSVWNDDERDGDAGWPGRLANDRGSAGAHGLGNEIPAIVVLSGQSYEQVTRFDLTMIGRDPANLDGRIARQLKDRRFG